MRCFIAIELTDPVRRAAAAACRRLVGDSRDVRLGPVEQLHITLRFLGDVDEARIAPVRDIVYAAAAAAPFDIAIGGLGCFPPRGPRVLWMGVADQGECGRLVRAMEAPLAELGFAPEARAFRPHITLGRSRNRAGGEQIRRIVDDAAEPERAARAMRRHDRRTPPAAKSRASRIAAAGGGPLSMRVEAITLFESRLGSGGAVHVPLLVAPLVG